MEESRHDGIERSRASSAQSFAEVAGVEDGAANSCQRNLAGCRNGFLDEALLYAGANVAEDDLQDVLRLERRGLL